MSGDELKNLTVGEFLHTLRQVVAEKGANYVYPESEKMEGMCRYWHNGQPSCIIGHALDRLGIAVPAEREGRNASVVLNDFGAPELVRWVALEAQMMQDDDGTWGEALTCALTCAKQEAALLANGEGLL